MQKPDWIADYDSLQSGAGYTVLQNWSIVDFQGPDRGKFLNAFCTNAVRELANGTIREVFITDVKGHTIGHGHVVAFGESLLFITVPDQAETLIKHFDRYIIREKVTLHDRTQELTIISLPAGKASAPYQTIMALAPDGSDAANFLSLEMPRAGSKLLIIEREKLSSFDQENQSVSLEECSYDAWNAYRIENGFPLFYADVTPDNLPQEVDRDKQAISFTKGCYLGQETVARIDALGQVNKLLVGLRIDGDANAISSNELTAEGKPAGRITTFSYSPRLNSTIALGYLKRQLTKAGTKLSLGNIPCEVVKLPIE